MHENSMMNPLKTVTNEVGGGEGLRNSNIDGVKLIEVHFMHVCKLHNETPLYN
jgi:hypothetical protein